MSRFVGVDHPKRTSAEKGIKGCLSRVGKGGFRPKVDIGLPGGERGNAKPNRIAFGWPSCRILGEWERGLVMGSVAVIRVSDSNPTPLFKR